MLATVAKYVHDTCRTHTGNKIILLFLVVPSRFEDVIFYGNKHYYNTCTMEPDIPVFLCPRCECLFLQSVFSDYDWAFHTNTSRGWLAGSIGGLGLQDVGDCPRLFFAEGQGWKSRVDAWKWTLLQCGENFIVHYPFGCVHVHQETQEKWLMNVVHVCSFTFGGPQVKKWCVHTFTFTFTFTRTHHLLVKYGGTNICVFVLSVSKW